MKPESEDLQHALSGEDADEAHVEVLEGKHPHLILAIVVQGHCQHVQPDEDHDNHVKLFVGYDSKNYRLWSPLKW